MAGFRTVFLGSRCYLDYSLSYLFDLFLVIFFVIIARVWFSSVFLYCVGGCVGTEFQILATFDFPLEHKCTANFPVYSYIKLWCCKTHYIK